MYTCVPRTRQLCPCLVHHRVDIALGEVVYDDVDEEDERYQKWKSKALNVLGELVLPDNDPVVAPSDALVRLGLPHAFCTRPRQQSPTHPSACVELYSYSARGGESNIGGQRSNINHVTRRVLDRRTSSSTQMHHRLPSLPKKQSATRRIKSEGSKMALN